MASSLAIVGMSCRFAGDIDTPEKFWGLIRDGRDGIGGLPNDRGWDLDELYDPAPSVPGKFYVKDGYFLRDPYGFDSDFFGISPREAKVTHPQQRITLELAWEALERAGIPPLSRRGTRSGVFIGCSNNMACPPVEDEASAAAFEHYRGTSTTSFAVSGRVSYTLGLEGAAITLDTGCSSGLVALHLAGQSLRLGECDLALVGGITVITDPGELAYFSRQRMSAPDGRCKPFSADADGSSFGEGACLLVLERLEDARRQGHPVLATVLGSAVGQDGATGAGLTAPSTPAQVKVIRAALDSAGLDPGQVDAVEAHGTGTVVGDPIEANALIEAYGQGRRPDNPLLVGSVKSNIGHTQIAAGAAGIMKMVLALQHAELPPTLHVDRPATAIDWQRGSITLLRESAPWPARGHPRRAGVSAFGLTGTNAHVILEEAPRPARRGTSTRARAAGDAGLALPFLLSARTEPALREQARRLAADPALEDSGASLADLGHALATSRTAFDRRAVILAAHRDDLRTRLRTLAAGDPGGRGIAVGRVRASAPVVFVFPGQGGQWAGMAARLLAEEPVFAKQAAACHDALAPHVDWSLLRVLEDPSPVVLDQVDVLQPVLFAVALSLAALWRSMGIEPDAVVGHSQGEIAAACVAGALSLDDAARLSALRAKALRQLAGTGMMASLPLSATTTRRLLEDRGRGVEIAAVNGPASTTIAGTVGAMRALIDSIAASGVEAKVVSVDYAAHSAQVEQIRTDVSRLMDGTQPRPSAVKFYSTVTGGAIDTSTLDSAYWWDNIRRPVRFADAVRALAADGFRTFIEAGPHPVLAPAIKETAGAAVAEREPVTVIGSLRRGHGGRDQFLSEVAKAWVNGLSVNWADSFGRGIARHVDLPTYPFQRRRYQLETTGTGAAAWRQHRAQPVPAGTALAGASRFPVGADRSGDLFLVDWQPVSAPAAVLPGPLATMGPGARALASALREGGCAVAEYPGPAELLRAVQSGAPAPHAVLVTPSAEHAGADRVGAAHAAAAWALGNVRTWLSEPGLAGIRLVLVTHGAVAADAGDRVSGFPAATVWGLARSAQSEHPGRVTLIDLDEAAGSLTAVAAALATGEPQVAIRDGVARVPRLIPAGRGEPPAAPLWREGTVLITGGTGLIGGQLARHLVASHGARHLLLVSRQGDKAPGARDLADDLRRRGAEVTVAACDVSNAEAIRSLVAAVPGEYPLTCVVHAAAALDDCVIANLTPERLHSVLSPKIDAAWNLYEATRHANLAAFLLFSSAAATLGTLGQGNYAAGNAFLDSFSAYLRQRGVPAMSLGWGLWAAGTGLSELTASDQARLMRSAGIAPIGSADALRLFDRAVGAPGPYLAAVRFDVPPGQGRDVAARPLSALVHAGGAGGPAGAGPLGDADDGGPSGRGPGQARALLGTVRGHAAVVLDHPVADAIDAASPFLELGFDSLTFLELAQRLSERTGVDVTASMIQESGTAAALAALLEARLGGSAAS